MTALLFWDNTGPNRESDYPYVSGDGSVPTCIYNGARLPYYTTNLYTTSGTKNIKASLLVDGPSYFSFWVYTDFRTWWDSAPFGSIYTNGSYDPNGGGHSVLIIGWDDAKGAFLCKNSWGATSGPNGDGTFWIAYDGHANDLGFTMCNFDVVNRKITVTSPNGGESWNCGSTYTIKWSSNNVTNVKIELMKSAAVNESITLSTASNGSYNWTIPSEQTPGSDYKIRITDTTNYSIADIGNANFSIQNLNLPDVIISKIELVPAAPTPGTPVTIKATIKNQGTAATPSGVDVGTGFRIDGVHLGSFFVKDANGNRTNLAAGASYRGSCNTVWTATAGTHKIKATADDVNRFAEADENNNSLEKSFTIANVLPDVIIQDIWLEPLSSGTNYNIHARIKNKGTVATPVGVYVGVGFKVDGVRLGSFFVTDANGVKTNLAAGASFDGVCTTQWVKVKGTHSFWATADDVNRFPESNEGNNARTESIAVQ